MWRPDAEVRFLCLSCQDELLHAHAKGSQSFGLLAVLFLIHGYDPSGCYQEQTPTYLQNMNMYLRLQQMNYCKTLLRGFHQSGALSWQCTAKSQTSYSS